VSVTRTPTELLGSVAVFINGYNLRKKPSLRLGPPGLFMDLSFGALYLFNPGTSCISRTHLHAGMACCSFRREYVEGWWKLTILERYLVTEEAMQVSSLHLGDLQILHLLYGSLLSECCSSALHRVEFLWS
jgi:hypothetical protein